MASLGRGGGENSRRSGMSPRPKGRGMSPAVENAKDTVCRNLTIYGHCRFENKGCAFNHDPMKLQNSQDSGKKRFNVDSPSFTPAATVNPGLAVNGGVKGTGDTSGFGKQQYNPAAPDWTTMHAETGEFIPQPQISHLLPDPFKSLLESERRFSRNQTSKGDPSPFNGGGNAAESPGEYVSAAILSVDNTIDGKSTPGQSGISVTQSHQPSSSLLKDNSRVMVFASKFISPEGSPVRREVMSNLSAESQPFRPSDVFSASSAPKRYFSSPIIFNSPERAPLLQSGVHRSLPLSFSPIKSPPGIFSTPRTRRVNLENIRPNSFKQTDNNGMQQAMFDYQMAQQQGHAQINPYQDPTAGAGNPYFQTSTFQPQLQYHLYSSLGPHRENLLPYQRSAHDFFISDTLREELQRKSAATQQTLPSSTVLPSIEHFHSLVPLDTTQQKNATLFGFPSWIYKAMSSKDGKHYALRRLEGFRLTNEKSIRSVQNWKRISCGNVVSILDIFTNRGFGDSSLFIVTDYFPLSKTLAETHFSQRFGGRGGGSGGHIAEQVLWGYIVQIANGLRAVHAAHLAARIIDPSKILLTGKNRIRLNACAILDVVQFDAPRALVELQAEDMAQFGRTITSLAVGTPTGPHNLQKSLDFFQRSAYSEPLKECVTWLLSGGGASGARDGFTIDAFIQGIQVHMLDAFDASLHQDDALTSDLNKELENSRIVRLMTKLNFIIDRPELGGADAVSAAGSSNTAAASSGRWSETGDLYAVKLFRDYVFHQVDSSGAPVLDLGHVVGCLNRLDAGAEEKMVLTSRDEQFVVVVSFREMKRAVESAYGELVKAARRSGGGI